MDRKESRQSMSDRAERAGPQEEPIQYLKRGVGSLSSESSFPIAKRSLAQTSKCQKDLIEKGELRPIGKYRPWELREFDIPPRHSRSLLTLSKISRRYKWLWSITVKGYDIDKPHECDKKQNALRNLLRNINRKLGTRFLLKREFDTERGRHWPHWHIYSPDPLTPEVKGRMIDGVLRITGQRDNGRRVYKFVKNDCSEDQRRCARYLRKSDKTPKNGGKRPTNTFYPPSGWAGHLKCRSFCLVGINRSKHGNMSNNSPTITTGTFAATRHKGRQHRPLRPNSPSSAGSGPLEKSGSAAIGDRVNLTRNAVIPGAMTEAALPRYVHPITALRAETISSDSLPPKTRRERVLDLVAMASRKNCRWFKHLGNPEKTASELAINNEVVLILRKGRAIYVAVSPDSRKKLPASLLPCMAVDTHTEEVVNRLLVTTPLSSSEFGESTQTDGPNTAAQ